MTGESFTLKKSLLLNLLFFRPLPVFTLSARISISKTALLTSVDENFIPAFHLSKVPLMGTEESTPNLTVLSTGVTSYTGTWARLAGGREQNTTSHRTVIGNSRVLTLAKSRVKFCLAVNLLMFIDFLSPNSLCSSDPDARSPGGGLNLD